MNKQTKKSLNVTVAIWALAINAFISIAYRFLKWIQVGNLADLIGQSVLGIIILIIAYLCWQKRRWAFILAIVYGVFFLIVTPLYTVNILLPGSPGVIDHAENIIYTIMLVIVIIYSYKSLKEIKVDTL